MLLFTYGTLKRGGYFNYHLNSSKYIGEYVTPPKYTLIDLGQYPAVLLKGKTGIYGEVWEINEETLASLDIVEGYPDLYDRKIINTEYGEAILYFMKEIVYLHSTIKSGVYENV